MLAINNEFITTILTSDKLFPFIKRKLEKLMNLKGVQNSSMAPLAEIFQDHY